MSASNTDGRCSVPVKEEHSVPSSNKVNDTDIISTNESSQSWNSGDGNSPEADPKPLSKNQMRKRKRMAYIAEKNALRKQQEKEMNRQKALAEGRDLDKERKEQEENAKNGEGHKRREEVGDSVTDSGVCVDFSSTYFNC